MFCSQQKKKKTNKLHNTTPKNSILQYCYSYFLCMICAIRQQITSIKQHHIRARKVLFTLNSLGR